MKEALTHFNLTRVKEIVGDDSGLVIDPSNAFVPDAINKIKTWLDNLKEFELATHSANKQFNQLREKNINNWNKLLNEIVGNKSE